MMFRSIISKWVILFLIILLPGILILFFSSAKHEFNKLPIVSDSINFKTNEFLDQDSVVFSDDIFKDKINVVCFFFSRCPSICPPMITNMNWLKNHFDKFHDINFISLTIDPEYDTPSVLGSYIIENRIIDRCDYRKNWYFLTGSRESIYNLAEDLFVSVKSDVKAPGGYLHSGSFILLDKEGRVRSRKDDNGNILAVYDGTSFVDVKNLQKDIQVLKAEYIENEQSKR